VLGNGIGLVGITGAIVANCSIRSAAACSTIRTPQQANAFDSGPRLLRNLGAAKPSPLSYPSARVVNRVTTGEDSRFYAFQGAEL
jgi:hypothetical protein